MCSAVHLPLDEFELGDLAFRLAVGPGLFDSGSNSFFVGGDASAEAAYRASSRAAIKIFQGDVDGNNSDGNRGSYGECRIVEFI